jgi:hypothetical protein
MMLAVMTADASAADARIREKSTGFFGASAMTIQKTHHSEQTACDRSQQPCTMLPMICDALRTVAALTTL